MKLFGFDTDESVQQIVAGSSNLPESAAGPKQKPLPKGVGYSWKPSKEQTEQDIIQADIRDKIIREATKAQQKPVEQKKQESQVIPTEDVLMSMSWNDLLELRRNAKTKEDQNKIAPYEHRAYAREYVHDNPEAILVMPGLAVAYNVLKGLDLVEGRSEASVKAAIEGIKGAIEGFGGRTRELFE